MGKAKHAEGQERFDIFYSDIYGERWPRLREALLEETNPVSLSGKLTVPYYMDKASILAASMLPISENNCVLDMCAAPGGKTLSIALRLNGKGLLVSNDRSASRRNRLIKVIDDCLNPQLKSVVKVTGHDSTMWSLHEKNTYDRILLDAPCSSERHVLTDPKALSQWSPNRPKQLAVQQFAMLAAALDAAKDGAFILYSTCSICPLENERIIDKLAKRRNGLFEEVDLLRSHPELEDQSEGLAHGRIVLPDVQGGSGPLYFCLLRKTQTDDKGDSV
ncbi:MAG: RsmB/NOP family class I SAM-dependent RNA methyltransferase [Spirochaetales bacterium]|nr:RsmB/NOP family class I SAM-dependent RNA methyltransferase [Spirochaetales bacterium]